MAQQIGIDLVVRMALAGTRLRTQRRHAHAQHERTHMLPPHLEAPGLKLPAQPPGAHEGMLQMQLVKPPHQRQIGGADRLWQVVHRPAAEAQQLGLARYRQAVLSVDHSFAPSHPALLSARAKKSNSSACCPILACSGARSTGSGPGATPKTSAARASNCRFQSVIWLG